MTLIIAVLQADPACR